MCGDRCYIGTLILFTARERLRRVYVVVYYVAVGKDSAGGVVAKSDSDV